MVLIERLRRPSAVIAAALLFLASLMPLLVNSKRADAYALLGDREIQMSSTQGGATGVRYLVTFDVATTGNVGGIVVTFCEGADSPIIEDTACTVPAGFSLTGATVANQSTNISTFTTVDIEDLDDSGDTDPNSFTLSNATAASLTAGNAVSFEINGATNPTHSSNPGTFYARIYTYATQAAAQGYTLANPNAVGNSVDAGGVALSTADQITIQSKVQERLTFCVYTSAINYTTCTGTTTTNPVVLGDANGVLDPVVDYVSKTTKYNITTNASNGATIRAKGATLTSGSFTIDAIGATAASSAEGSEQFGFCTYRDTGGGVAGLTPAAPYNNASCSSTTQGSNGDGGAQFAFDTSTACNTSNATPANPNTFESQALNCRYGDSIATKSAGAMSTGIVAFIGNISNTTEPGIYTSTMTFIATGNY